MGTGTSLSSLSTTNNTMIDLDFETGSIYCPSHGNNASCQGLSYTAQEVSVQLSYNSSSKPNILTTISPNDIDLDLSLRGQQCCLKSRRRAVWRFFLTTATTVFLRETVKYNLNKTFLANMY